MPMEGHLRSPQKNNSHHSPGSKRGGGTFGRSVPHGVRPEPFSGSQFHPDNERNYGTYGSPNYRVGSNPTRGARSNRGFGNGPSPGNHFHRGSSHGRDGTYGVRPYLEQRFGLSHKVRPNQNGYSAGQFHDQGFVPRIPGSRGGYSHRAGFQQRGRSWMGRPRFP